MKVKYQLWNEDYWTNFIHHDSIRAKLPTNVNILSPPFPTRYPKLARIHETPSCVQVHLDPIR